MRKTEIVSPIVSEQFILLRSDGVRTVLVVEIGHPYVVDEIESRCPARIEGLDPQYPDITGESRLQALSLALRLIQTRLEHVIERGDVLKVEDEDKPLDRESLDALFGTTSFRTRA
jgi:hypothetical protein